MSALSPELTVRRPVYQQDELDHLCKYAKPNEARKYRTRTHVDFDRANIRNHGLFAVNQPCNPHDDTLCCREEWKLSWIHCIIVSKSRLKEQFLWTRTFSCLIRDTRFSSWSIKLLTVKINIRYFFFFFFFFGQFYLFPSRLTTCAGNWLRTITSDRIVYNIIRRFLFWTRRYDITG